MKKIMFLTAGACMLFLGGCVESSQKYKNLQARLDSLSVVQTTQNAEMEDMLTGLNDISAGMQSLRDAEHLLTLEADKENKSAAKSKEQVARLKSDITAISEAIVTYKEQIKKLEGKNKQQSAEFRKMIDGLNAELELRTQKIAEITRQLGEKDKELALKAVQISGLNQNVDSLSKESAEQKMTIATQDQEIHLANYLLGTKKELKDANVVSRQGLFCPPIVSSQAQGANFVSVDIRELNSIPLNSKKAKILSVHPAESYTLEAGEDGMMILKITDANVFWKQTKYLVVMVG